MKPIRCVVAAVVVALFITGVMHSRLLAGEPASDKDLVELRVKCPAFKVKALRNAAARLGLQFLPVEEGVAEETRKVAAVEVIPLAAWNALIDLEESLKPDGPWIVSIRVYQTVVVLGLRGHNKDRVRGCCHEIQRRLTDANHLAVRPGDGLGGMIEADLHGYGVDLALVFRPVPPPVLPAAAGSWRGSVRALIRLIAMPSGLKDVWISARKEESEPRERATWEARCRLASARQVLHFVCNLSSPGACSKVVPLTAAWNTDDPVPADGVSLQGLVRVRVCGLPAD